MLSYTERRIACAPLAELYVCILQQKYLSIHKSVIHLIVLRMKDIDKWI